MRQVFQPKDTISKGEVDALKRRIKILEEENRRLKTKSSGVKTKAGTPPMAKPKPKHKATEQKPVPQAKKKSIQEQAAELEESQSQEPQESDEVETAAEDVVFGEEEGSGE